jgi:DNA-binding GntR family transcriptional regulator
MSMTSYIKNDLVAQLCRKEIGAEDLTLQGIAGRYGVSLTPVRAALRELIDEGYVKKRKNRRLDVDMSQVNRAERGTAIDVAPPKDYFAIITQDLIRLSLKGEMVSLREESIADQYGLSRTTVRQILNRLAGQGVLQHKPRHGWVLRAFQPTDLDEYIEVRTVLERKALELAWPYLEDAELQRMLDGNRLPENEADQPVNDNSLHDYLVKKSGNQYIADFFARHGQYYAILFEWEASDRKALETAICHHRRILEALLARDFKAADEALVEHIRNNHYGLKTLLNLRGHRQSLTLDSPPACLN